MLVETPVAEAAAVDAEPVAEVAASEPAITAEEPVEAADAEPPPPPPPLSLPPRLMLPLRDRCCFVSNLRRKRLTVLRSLSTRETTAETVATPAEPR